MQSEIIFSHEKQVKEVSENRTSGGKQNKFKLTALYKGMSILKTPFRNLRDQRKWSLKTISRTVTLNVYLKALKTNSESILRF